MRQYLGWLGHDSYRTLHRNVWWMGWNLVLALVPAVLGVLLFHRPHRHRLVWWAGVAVFIAFLPNAPYVATDLVHLPDAVAATQMRGTVIVALLPIFTAFVAVGFACYAVALTEAVGALRRGGYARWTAPAEVLAHLAAAVGVLLGRVIRLNSWTPLAHPRVSADRAAALLAEPQALVVVIALAAGFGLAHHVVTRVGRAAAGWAGPRLAAGGHPAA